MSTHVIGFLKTSPNTALSYRRAGWSRQSLSSKINIQLWGLSALEIGLETGTSDATVIRSIQTLGFSGLLDLKNVLKQWLNEAESVVTKLAKTSDDIGSDVHGAIDFVISSQQAALVSLGTPENRSELQKAVSLISKAKSVGIVGIAASGILAEYGARLFSRSGIPAKT